MMQNNSQYPLIALLGRPNVGKSTLFNRLIKSNRAITHDMPGITRDRLEGIVKRKGKTLFRIMDTGGVTLDSANKSTEGPSLLHGFEEEILKQAKEAVMQSALVCLVVDARDGLTPFDQHLADYLRKCNKPLLLIVNKVDGPERIDLLTAEFHSLGIPFIACSAAHGFNIAVLEEEFEDILGKEAPIKVVESFEEETRFDVNSEEQNGVTLKQEYQSSKKEKPAEQSKKEDNTEKQDKDEQDEPQVEDGSLRLALLGKPNAGKSSLVNALLGTERMIVSNIPGTTRDSVDVQIEIDGRLCTFVDTAGVRRPARVVNTVEKYSVSSSLKSTSKADITLLVIAADEGLSQQDKRLIELLSERKSPFMLIVNKADLLSPQERKQAEKDYKMALVFCPHIPLLFVSALKKSNLKKIIPLAQKIKDECSLRIGTGVLNRSLEASLAAYQAPMVKGVRPKFFYMTQAESKPPTFVFFVNDAEKIQDAYSRYLEKSLRKLFGIQHAPMRLNFRSAHKKKGKSKK